MSAADLATRNRRRRRVRFWIAIGTLPLTLVALALVVKLLSMVAFAQASVTAYAADDFPGSVAAARGQAWANWFEPYKAPYNAGVGLAASGQLPQARTEFRKALELATGDEVCAVRFNLALTLEWMGDKANTLGDPSTATSFYSEALEVVAAMPDQCDKPEADQNSPDPSRVLEDDSDESEQRLRDKLQPPPPTPQTEEEKKQQQQQQEQQQQQQPSESELDELKKQLQQGTRERDLSNEGDPQGGSGVEKPW